MAGSGAYPIRSAWLSRGPRPNTPILYERISFGDNNADEKALWDTWFFGATNFSLALSAGVFTITGNAAGFTAPLSLALSAGSYTITGNAATLAYSAGFSLALNTGSFTITGNDAHFNGPLFGQAGSFAILGYAAGLQYSGAASGGGRAGIGFAMGRFGGSATVPFSASSPPPTAFGLTDITAGQLFQRTSGLTTGPVSASGTYTGGLPSAIQFQVLKVSDNSIVKDWTTCGTATINGGTWSATLTGVAQGGAYYVKARPFNAVGLAQAGSNSFYIGILFAIYGQSNAANLSLVGSAPIPSASAGTTWFNGTTWAAVPSANGLREILNAVVAATGVPCGALNGAVGGQSISTLKKGTANYTAFMAQVTGAGNDSEMIIWHEGEGDSAIGTQKYAYSSSLDQLHSDIATDIGRTRTTMPMIVAGLGTITNGDTAYGTDATWDPVQAGILNMATRTATYFSHSNRDAVINNADVHYDGQSQGRAGKRYGRAANTVLGATAGFANFGITSSAVVDATHTTVDITHGLGTDFTPTSGITGFTLSGDNGLTSVTPSAAVRTSATRITLTHSSLPTSSLRKLKYLAGQLPDMSGAVFDNSTYAVPMNDSGDWLSPTPLTTLPVPIYIQGAVSDVATASQTVTGIALGPAATRRLVIVSFSLPNPSLTAMTITPNVGTAKAATIADQTAGTPGVGIAYAVLDADADTATQANISLTYSANPFGQTVVNLWVLPSGDLSSTTPTGHANVRTAGVTNVSVNVATSAGGFIIAVAADNNITTNSGAVSGSESWIGRRNLGGQGLINVAADASGTAASASNTVTATFTNSANTSLVAVAWR